MENKKHCLMLDDAALMMTERFVRNVVTSMATIAAIYTGLWIGAFVLKQWPEMFGKFTTMLLIVVTLAVPILIAYVICGDLWYEAYRSYVGMLKIQQRDPEEPIKTYFYVTDMVRTYYTPDGTKARMAVTFVVYLGGLLVTRRPDLQLLWNILDYAGLTCTIVTVIVAWCEVRIITGYSWRLGNELCMHNANIITMQERKIQEMTRAMSAENTIKQQPEEGGVDGVLPEPQGGVEGQEPNWPFEEGGGHADDDADTEKN